MRCWFDRWGAWLRTLLVRPQGTRGFGEILDEALRDTDRMSIRIGALERACSEGFEDKFHTEGAQRAFMRR